MTYSIVAFDTATGRSGSAAASCIPLDILKQVPSEVPGRGAFVTQSYLVFGADERATAVLQDGGTAEATIAALVDPSFDPDFTLRQYAVVDTDGGVAAFTGSRAPPFAADRQKRSGSFVFSVQGNTDTSDAVFANMEAAFVADGACDLSERLVRALEAAGKDGGGDSRCTTAGRPAQSALVRGADLALDAESKDVDPTIALRASFEEWRKTHPCPPPPASDADGCRITSSSFDVSVVLPLLALVALRRWRAAPRRLTLR